MTTTDDQRGRFVPHPPASSPTGDAPRARGLSWFGGVGVIVGLELRQRVRGVAFYVLLGLFVVLMLLVSVPLGLLGGDDLFGTGGSIYSVVIYFVLLLGTLIVPALSGNAINGDRDAGTLATTQVTLVSASQIVIGKFLAAWITALAFLAVSIPFLVVAYLGGDLSTRTILASLGVLAIELAVVAAIGVGLSGVLTRPLFSVAVTYLIIAALSIGTAIAFGLGGVVTKTPVTQTYIGLDYSDENLDPETGELIDARCLPPETSTYDTPRFDFYWGLLAANPYVVLADAAAGDFGSDGQPRDLFSGFAYGVRSAQIPPESETVVDECARGYDADSEQGRSPEDVYNSTVPTWFVGLALHVLLGGGLLAWAIARTRTPAQRLARGSRIA